MKVYTVTITDKHGSPTSHLFSDHEKANRFAGSIPGAYVDQCEVENYEEYFRWLTCKSPRANPSPA